MVFYERSVLILLLCDSSPEEKLVDCTEHLQSVNRYHDHEGNMISLHDEARSQVANIGLIPMYLNEVLSAQGGQIRLCRFLSGNYCLSRTGCSETIALEFMRLCDRIVCSRWRLRPYS
jgi:hypothetical protein